MKKIMLVAMLIALGCGSAAAQARTSNMISLRANMTNLWSTIETLRTAPTSTPARRHRFQQIEADYEHITDMYDQRWTPMVRSAVKKRVEDMATLIPQLNPSPAVAARLKSQTADVLAVLE